MCLRTSWLHSNDGHNFFLTMKRLFRERDVLNIVTDQWGVPTTTDFLAEVTLALIDVYRKPKGDLPQLVHAVPCGSASWFEFASYIRHRLCRKKLGEGLADIRGISSSEFPQIAERPANSILSNDLLQSILGKPVGSWQEWHNKLY